MPYLNQYISLKYIDFYLNMRLYALGRVKVPFPWSGWV